MLKVLQGLLKVADTELPIRLAGFAFSWSQTLNLSDILLLRNVLNETQATSLRVQPDRHKYVQSMHKLIILQSHSDMLAWPNQLHGHSKSNTRAGSWTSSPVNNQLTSTAKENIYICHLLQRDNPAALSNKARRHCWQKEKYKQSTFHEADRHGQKDMDVSRWISFW